MATVAIEATPQDDLTRTVARVLAAANAAATAEGIDPASRLLTITEESPPPDRVWRDH